MSFLDEYIDFESALRLKEIEDEISPNLHRVDPLVNDLPKRCLYPVPIHPVNAKGFKDYIRVPCGKCLVCLAKQANQWYIRFQIEQSQSKDSFFVTLTQSDDKYEPLSVDVMQRYFKRVRSMGFKFSYCCLGEYGPRTARAHYHVLFFLKDGDYVEFLHAVKAQWETRGFVTVERPTKNHLFYVAKYNSKLFLKNVTFKLTSRRPAIGLSYSPDSSAARFMDSYLLSGDMTFFNSEDGLTYAIPRYYRKKADELFHAFDSPDDKPVQYDKLTFMPIQSEYERYYYELARGFNSFCQRKL